MLVGRERTLHAFLRPINPFACNPSVSQLSFTSVDVQESPRRGIRIRVGTETEIGVGMGLWLGKEMGLRWELTSNLKG